MAVTLAQEVAGHNIQINAVAVRHVVRPVARLAPRGAWPTARPHLAWTRKRKPDPAWPADSGRLATRSRLARSHNSHVRQVNLVESETYFPARLLAHPAMYFYAKIAKPILTSCFSLSLLALVALQLGSGLLALPVCPCLARVAFAVVLLVGGMGGVQAGPPGQGASWGASSLRARRLLCRPDDTAVVRGAYDSRPANSLRRRFASPSLVARLHCAGRRLGLRLRGALLTSCQSQGS
jgi:hypothetical protein